LQTNGDPLNRLLGVGLNQRRQISPQLEQSASELVVWVVVWVVGH
jgi:hypothetical protein